MLRVGLIILCAGFGGIFLGSMATSRLLQPPQVHVASVRIPAARAQAAAVTARVQLDIPWMPEILPVARVEYVSLPDDLRHAGKRAMTARNSRAGRSERIAF